MLPRSERLTTAEFALAFERGRVLRHPLLHLRVHVREAGSGARAAFVVPKKLGQATVRNRARRRIRERYRLHPLRHAAGLSCCDFIFMATAEAIGAGTEQLDAAVTQLLRRAAGVPRHHKPAGGAPNAEAPNAEAPDAGAQDAQPVREPSVS